MKRYLTAVLSAILLNASAASAQFNDSFSTPFGPGSQSTLRLNGGRSYSCVVDGSGDYTLSVNITGPTGPITGSYPNADPDALRGRFTSSAAFGDVNLGNNLIAFNTPRGPASFGDYTFTMAAVNGASANPTISCIDSTFVCNFNTFLSDAIFLEVVNSGARDLPFTYRLVDFDGNATDVRENVPPGVRRDFRVDTSVGRRKYGSVIILPESAFLFFGEDLNARVSHYNGGDLKDTETCGSVVLFGLAG